VRLSNWAGNVTYGAGRLHRPTSVEQVQELVAGSRRIRALGSAHSFSRVADTDGDLLSLAGLPARVEVSDDRRSVIVGGGVRYGEVAPRLQAAGLALHNLGSLPHICVAGAVATGTHGSGDGLGSLATAVLGLDLVTGGGDLLRLDRSDPRFPGAVVGLGSLGVVTALTLAVEPAYDVTQHVVVDVNPGTVRGNLGEVFAAGDSVSAFATWAHGDPVRIWVKRRTDRRRPALDPGWLGGRPATRPAHPVTGDDPAACTEQLGRPGPWHERLPHFRLDHTPSHGDELQTEYLVPREHAVDALDAVAALGDRIAPLLLVSELRTVAADGLWLSPAYGRDSFAVHFTWRPDTAAVLPVLTALEAALAPFDARPHWGKVFTTDADTVAALYPRHAEARALRRDLDPDDVFGSAFADTFLPR
jgi:alditol oxidase